MVVTAYNVQTSTADGFVGQTVSTEVESIAADAEVLSTYFIPQLETQDVTIEAYGNKTMTLTGGYTYTDTKSAATANNDLCHFYVLTDGTQNQELTMQYNGVLGNPAVTLPNVPLAPNTRVTLTGDVYHLRLTSGGIKATVSTGWTDQSYGFNW